MSGTDLPREFVDRIAQAIGDPGSVVGRKLGPSWGEGNDGYAENEETVTRWSTRAVLEVLVASGYRREAKVPEHLLGDGPCTDCGTVDNIVWFTDSVFWNAVVRQGDYQEPILCIPCFVKRADAAGFYPTGWRLTPEFHWETHEERAARWPDPGPLPVRCRLCPGLPYYAAEDYQGHVLGVHGDRATALEQAQPLLAADLCGEVRTGFPNGSYADPTYTEPCALPFDHEEDHDWAQREAREAREAAEGQERSEEKGHA